MHELRPRAHTSAKGPLTNGTPSPVRKGLVYFPNKRGNVMPPDFEMSCHSSENQLAKEFVKNMVPLHNKKMSLFVRICTMAHLYKGLQLAASCNMFFHPNRTPSSPDLLLPHELYSLLHQRSHESSIASSERKRIHLAYGTCRG